MSCYRRQLKEWSWGKGSIQEAGVKTIIVGLINEISRKREPLDGENAVGHGTVVGCVGGLGAESRLGWQQQAGLQWQWV